MYVFNAGKNDFVTPVQDLVHAVRLEAKTNPRGVSDTGRILLDYLRDHLSPVPERANASVQRNICRVLFTKSEDVSAKGGEDEAMPTTGDGSAGVQRYFHLHTFLQVDVKEALAIISSLFSVSSAGIFVVAKGPGHAVSLRSVFDALVAVIRPLPDNPFKFSKSELRHCYKLVANYAGGPLAPPGAGERGIGEDLAKEAFLVS